MKFIGVRLRRQRHNKYSRELDKAVEVFAVLTVLILALLRLVFSLLALAYHLTTDGASEDDADTGDQEPCRVQAVVCQELVVSDQALAGEQPCEVVCEHVDTLFAVDAISGAQERVDEFRVLSLDFDLVGLVRENLRPAPTEVRLRDVPGAVAHFPHAAGLCVVVYV